MKIAKMIALAGLLVMTGFLIYGFTMGDFANEGARLLSMPWVIVSLVDLYVGFALFSCWIVFREKALLPSAIWVILMMVLGFCRYAGKYTPLRHGFRTCASPGWLIMALTHLSCTVLGLSYQPSSRSTVAAYNSSCCSGS